jgi:hypothetical protein
MWFWECGVPVVDHDRLLHLPEVKQVVFGWHQMGICFSKSRHLCMGNHWQAVIERMVDLK